MAAEKICNVKKKHNIIFPMILRLLGRKSIGEEGIGDENQDKKI